MAARCMPSISMLRENKPKIQRKDGKKEKSNLKFSLAELTTSNETAALPMIFSESKFITSGEISSCTYNNDYNILVLHNQIVRILGNKNIGRDKYEARLLDLKLQLRGQISPSQLKIIIDEIKHIKKLLQEFNEEELSYNFIKYNEEVKPILEKYAVIGPLQEKFSISKGSTTEENIDTSSALPPLSILESLELADVVTLSVPTLSTVEKEYRLMLISKYLDIAKKYINLNIRHVDLNTDKCIYCSVKYEEDIDDSGYMQCPICNVQVVVFQGSSELTEENLNMSKKNSYENKGTFDKEFLKLQGKEAKTIPEEVYLALDDYFYSLDNSPTRDIVAERPLLTDGTRMGTDMKLMLKALQDTGMSTYYKHVYKICKEYWSWVLWDFSDEFREQLLNDYDISQTAIAMVPTDKTSSMNAQYNLYWLLKHRGIDCRPSQFKMPITPDILKDYERRRKAACCILIETDPSWACDWSISINDL